MKQNSPENKQKILKHLQKHYQQTGKDFYFKSKHINIPCLNVRVTGRLLIQLVKEKKIRMWSGMGCRHEYTFVTIFKNNGESRGI
jgi:hypothetical protein